MAETPPWAGDRPSMVRWVAWALLAGAVMALGTRFLDREQVAYVLDEPQLQDAAVAGARTGSWASISVVRGTQGLRYGPSALWFYGAVHRLAGPRPEVGILGAGLFLTAAIAWLVCALARRTDAPLWTLGAGLWIAAASPFAFFWARQGWDNPLLAGFAALAVAVLARRTAPGLGWSAVLGALLGLAVGTHLMAVPFVAAVLWVVASDGRSWKGRIRTLAVAGGTATVVLIPYLGALARDGGRIAHGRSVPLGAHLAATLEALTAPVRQVAGLGVGYFFDQDWTHFAASGLGAALPMVGPCVALVVGAVALLGLLLGRRSPVVPLRSVARLGLWAWIAHAAFLGVLALPPEPHYQQPVIWVPVAGWALAVGSLWPLRPAPAMAAALLAGAVGGWGLGLQQTWMEWIRNNGGTRGIHYGLPIGVQRQALAESCAVDAPAIALQTQLVIFPQSVVSLARTEPACQGRRVVVCGPACPALPAGWAVATLRYADATSARLGPIR